MTDQEMREYDLRTSESRAQDDKRRAIAQGATLAMLRANGVSKAVFTAEGLVSVEFFDRDPAPPGLEPGTAAGSEPPTNRAGFFGNIPKDDPLLDTAKK